MKMLSGSLCGPFAEPILSQSMKNPALMTKLLDAQFFSEQRRPGVNGHGIGACYTVALKKRPENIVEYVKSRLGDLDRMDWWWTEKQEVIYVSITPEAMVRIHEQKNR